MPALIFLVERIYDAYENDHYQLLTSRDAVFLALNSNYKTKPLGTTISLPPMVWGGVLYYGHPNDMNNPIFGSYEQELLKLKLDYPYEYITPEDIGYIPCEAIPSNKVILFRYRKHARLAYREIIDAIIKTGRVTFILDRYHYKPKGYAYEQINRHPILPRRDRRPY